MALLVSTPHLADLVQPFLTRQYAPRDCWKFVIDLMVAGGLIEADEDPAHVIARTQEIWWDDDLRDPIALSQPWDWWLLQKSLAFPAIQHIALVVDSQMLVHVSPAKADAMHLRPAQQRLRLWKPRLVQIARLRVLL